jgi:hypothetical protein
MKLFTIGFTKTTAKNFFDRLKLSGAKKILDVRLNNVSQLAGFAKRDDLSYFAKTICGMGYQHMSDLAPTKDILDAFKNTKGLGKIMKRNLLISWQTEGSKKLIESSLMEGACYVARTNRIIATAGSLQST